MEIVIRTPGTEAVVWPDAQPPSDPASGAPGAAQRAAVPDTVAAKASAIGALNAGSAPAAPGETGTPPVNVSAAEDLQVPPGGAGESAGTAPTLQQ